MLQCTNANVRTICMKIIITTGHDCGSAEWINGTSTNWRFSWFTRGRPTVTAGVITIFARVVCTSVLPSVPLFKFSPNKQLSSENSDRYWRDCGPGRVDHWWKHMFCSYCFQVVLYRGVFLIQAWPQWNDPCKWEWIHSAPIRPSGSIVTTITMERWVEGLNV